MSVEGVLPRRIVLYRRGAHWDMTTEFDDKPTRSTMYRGGEGMMCWDEMLGLVASVTMPPVRVVDRRVGGYPGQQWLMPFPALTEGDRAGSFERNAIGDG